MARLLTYMNRHTSADLFKDDRMRGRVSQVLFGLTFFVYMTASLLQYTSVKTDYPDLNSALTALTWICVYLAVANAVLFADFSLMQLILYAVMGVILYFSYKNCGTRLLFQGYVMALSARQVEWRKLVRGIVCYLGAFLAVCLGLYAAGVLTGYEFFKNGRARLVLGYNHPNVLGCIIMVFGLVWIACRIKKPKLWDYLIVAALTIFCWAGPMSRTAAISLGAALLLMAVQQLWGDRLLSLVWIRWLLVLSSPICFLLIFSLSYFYTPDNAFLAKANAFLNGRAAFGRAFLEKYYHTWMGQKIKMVGTAEAERTGKANMYLDSAYMRLYVSLGILALFIFLFLMIAAMLYAIRQRDWGIIIGLLAFGLYGISEVYMIYVFFDVFLIGAAYMDPSDGRLLMQRGGGRAQKAADGR
jgi:hypothetical protein